jgi:hypothetical protein
MGTTGQTKTVFKAVDITGAKVTGDVSVDGATFEGDLKALATQVGLSLFMGATGQNETSFKGVDLSGQKSQAMSI